MAVSTKSGSDNFSLTMIYDDIMYLSEIHFVGTKILYFTSKPTIQANLQFLQWNIQTVIRAPNFCVKIIDVFRSFYNAMDSIR